MIYFLIFLSLIVIFTTLSDKSKNLDKSKLNIYRVEREISCFSGQPATITTIIENRRKMPIWFLVLEETMPSNVSIIGKYEESKLGAIINKNLLMIWGKERVIRSYNIKAEKRGVYVLKDLKVGLGDFLGFSTKDYTIEGDCEIIIYPNITKLSNLVINNTSISGNEIVKRWIYNDPLYIKGIREYSCGNSFKDIHWKSTLKAQKLMVKEYDFTSDLEVVFIINTQCGDPYYSFLDEGSVDRAIEITLSLCHEIQDEGVKTGIWTNAHLVGLKRKAKDRVRPSANNFKTLLDLCSRIDYSPYIDITSFLKKYRNDFKKESTYVFVTAFLSDNIIDYLYRIKRQGFIIKIIDVSKDSSLPNVPGIEILRYKGEHRNEEV